MAAKAKGDGITVVTFATPDYENAAALLRHSAIHAGGAARVVVHTPATIARFFQENPALDTKARGYAFWSWKPYVILETLRECKGRVLYLDAAVIVKKPLEGLFDAGRPMSFFQLGEAVAKKYTNRRWTKKECLEALGVTEDDDAIKDAYQANAAIQAYEHCPDALKFLETYLEACRNPAVVSDAASSAQDPEFQDHRHDQSVLSVLLARIKYPMRPDITQFTHPDPFVEHHRQRYKSLLKVAVITPTIGGPHLRDCIRSVQAQVLPNITHYIVVDGPQYAPAVADVADSYKHGAVPVVTLVLPQNTGANGWNGHRIYGSLPFLVNATHVAYLDDDNTMDPHHIQNLARAVVKGGEGYWAHSLRRIVDAAGTFVCNDNCESLGGISHTICGQHDYLVDTSCYLLPRDLAIAAGPHWNAAFRSGKPEADREVTKFLLSSAPHALVRDYSLAYRVANTPNSVSADFFAKGNAVYRHDFGAKPDLYLFHFSKAATQAFFDKLFDGSRNHALDQWQPTLWRDLAKTHNLINGFSNYPNIPPGATLLVAICDPGDLPLAFFAERADVRKILYTLESPNIRHAAQWDRAFLAKHFDVILTYWAPLLADSTLKTAFCPHNCHHLAFPDDLQVLRTPKIEDAGPPRACVVAERRQLSGTYAVNGVTLACLDPMREVYVRRLAAAGVPVVVHGVGWDSADSLGPGVTVAHALHRSEDPRTSVDIMEEFTFAIIVENTDAEGYCSEKLYDALIAGVIPLYHGSVPARLQIPDDVYVDLKKVPIEDVAKLGADDIRAYKDRIAAARESILEKVGTKAFGDVVRSVL